MKENFLWGASTSAFQVEGAAFEDGKGLTVADVRSAKKKDLQMDTTVSVDHYHNLEEDVLLMKELGMKSYRFSISWARIFPNGIEEEPNKKGLDFYRDVFEELKKYNIEPLVTISHYDTPLYLEEELDGWKNRKLISLFDRYTEVLFNEYKGLVKYWLTFNEINSLLMFKDFIHNMSKDDIANNYKALHNQFVASARAVQRAH